MELLEPDEDKVLPRGMKPLPADMRNKSGIALLLKMNVVWHPTVGCPEDGSDTDNAEGPISPTK